jgi:phytoene synthase
VREDWLRGRLYVPADLLAECAAPPLTPELGAALPHTAAAGLARATERLLQLAADYYRSGDAGLCYLSNRCGFSIRAARLVYSEIAARLRAQDCDPFAPRAVVSRKRKWELVGYAAWQSLSALPQAALTRHPRPAVPFEHITRPETVFAVA